MRNFTDPQEILNKKENFIKILSILGIVVVGAVIAPVLFKALQAALALMAIGLISAITIFAGPVLVRKAARMRFDALVEEAKNNPVFQIYKASENMDNQIKLAKEAIAQGHAAATSFIETARKIISSTDNPETQKKYRERIELYEKRIQLREQKYKEALTAKKRFDQEAEIALLEWDALLLDKAASAAFNKLGGEDHMEAFLTKTAFKSVMDQTNAYFNTLRLEVIEEDFEAIETKALEAQKPTFNPASFAVIGEKHEV